MNNELNKHKNSDKVKWWLTLIAFLLIAATLAGMLLGYLTPRNNEEKPVQNEQQETADIGGLVVNESVNSGMSFKSVKLMKNDYETYGVTQSAESAFVLSATITPDTAENQGVDWSSFWLGANSEFALNESISDYVSFTPLEDGKSVLIECIAPFGDTIVVQAISQDNPNAMAFCELDYAQKILGVEVYIGNIPIVLDGTTDVIYEVCPYMLGMGGEITVEIETNDVYTKSQNFEKTITFAQDSVSDNWFRLNDKYPTGIQLLYREGVTNWVGETYYFDYTNDISNWIIFRREGDVVFSQLSTTQVLEYFNNITSPTLAIMTLTIEGEYDSYSYTSRINCEGYTNSTPVNALNLDRTNYVF